MRELLLVFCGYLLLVLQTTLCPAIPVAGAEPDLVTLAMVFTALNAYGNAAVVCSWALGLARDLTAVGPLGAYAFTYALTGYLLSRARQDLYKEHVLTVMLVVFGITAAVNWITTMLALVISGGAAGPFRLAVGAVGVGVYTAAVTPPVFWLLRRLRRVLGMAESLHIG